MLPKSYRLTHSRKKYQELNANDKLQAAYFQGAHRFQPEVREKFYKFIDQNLNCNFLRDLQNRLECHFERSEKSDLSIIIHLKTDSSLRFASFGMTGIFQFCRPL